MSVGITEGTTASRGDQGNPGRYRIGLALYFWSTTLVITATLVAGLAHDRESLLNELPLVLAWIATTALADLRPVPVWRFVSLSMSLPVTLAAGIVLSPWLAGLVAFAGAFDPRELSGDVTVSRALFNRSQVAGCVMAASWAFHATGVELSDWPAVIGVVAICLAIDGLANLALVTTPAGLLSETPFLEVLRQIFGDEPASHAISYMCLGMMGLPLAMLVMSAGVWGLLVSIVPVLIAREMFARGIRLKEYHARLLVKDEALRRSTENLALERRDERLVIAGELHDEVLPPLFKVHLMGQVLRADLNRGRLLDLDDDLPALLEATEAAQLAIRDLVRDLRHSPLGPGGLLPTIELLAREMESTSSCRFHLELGPVEASQLTLLLAYQVVREAMTNACRHAEAMQVRVAVWQEGDQLRLIVADDGRGFSPPSVANDKHFGLQLISERVDAGGGRVVIDSQPGSGTRIAASLPTSLM